jgi:hypothetical protein
VSATVDNGCRTAGCNDGDDGDDDDTPVCISPAPIQYGLLPNHQRSFNLSASIHRVHYSTLLGSRIYPHHQRPDGLLAMLLTIQYILYNILLFVMCLYIHYTHVTPCNLPNTILNWTLLTTFSPLKLHTPST